MLLPTGPTSRIVTTVIAGASFALVVSTSSCKDDEATGAGADAGGATGTFDGSTTPPPTSSSSGDPPANGSDGGTSSGTLPGGALAFPLDVALMSRGRPLNLDTVTDITIDSSLQYTTAYRSDGGLVPLAYYRFRQRSHTALAELPPAGVRVWWQRLRDDNSVGNYICREKNAVSGITTLKSNQSAGTENEPDNVWRHQCSWTLWKHPTQDTWYLRVPEGTSTDEGGTFVEDVHGGATEGYRIRVGGSSIGLAPAFTFRSKI